MDLHTRMHRPGWRCWRPRITAGAGLGLRWGAALLVVVTALGRAAAQGPATGQRGHASVSGTVHFGMLAALRSRPPTPCRTESHSRTQPPPLSATDLASLSRAATTAPANPAAPPPRTLCPAGAGIQLSGPTDNGTTIPPDTNGAVSPNYLMVPLNSQVRVQSRTGGTVSTVSLDGFWSGVPAAYDVFDPRVLYDPFAARWIVTSAANRRAPDSSILVAVSQTDNPADGWYEYLIDGDATDATWVDYPNVGFNKDWIVVQANMFNMSESFVRSHIFVFNKADLYAGGSGSYSLFQSNSFTVVPAVTYDNTLATLYLLTTLFSSQGSLELLSINGPVGAESMGSGTIVSSPANPWFPLTGPDFAPQLGSTHGIDTGDHRMHSVVYRNGFVWAAHTVILPTPPPSNRTAVQWWQIAPNGSVIQIGRVDDPTGNRFFAFPSLAVNARNDVLIGYSSFAATQYASASYSFRASTDPPNTMRDEVVLKAGLNPYYKVYGGDENRWGDYSATVVDPANDSDMWTIQEFWGHPG